MDGFKNSSQIVESIAGCSLICYIIELSKKEFIARIKNKSSRITKKSKEITCSGKQGNLFISEWSRSFSMLVLPVCLHHLPAMK